MKTFSLRSVVGASSLAIAAIAASLVACSAEDGTTELEPEVAEQANPGGFDPSIPLADKYDMELTADERARIDAHYASLGMPEAQYSFHGRVIAIEGDMLVDADYLLSTLDRVEKGQVTAGSGGFGVGSLARCADGVAPQGNECPTGKFLFFRPWIDSKYHVVVGDANTPSYYFDLVKAATDTIENITNDQPSSSLFDVKTLAQYNALSATEKLNYKITVTISPCPTSSTALACMETPLQTTEQTPNGETRKMRLGRNLYINQSQVQANNAKNVGVLIHEFLHSFGVGHINFEPQFFKIYVPGTLKPTTNPPSIMWSTTAPPWTQTLQADDIDMMRTLFPPGKLYFNGFSVVNAN